MNVVTSNYTIRDVDKFMTSSSAPAVTSVKGYKSTNV